MGVSRVNIGGLAVSAQGLGCMGMSQTYGAADWDESVATIRRALDLGVTFVDTADVYGAGHNEVLVGRAIGAFGRRVLRGHDADTIGSRSIPLSRSTPNFCGKRPFGQRLV